jgi:hypothetical protein
MIKNDEFGRMLKKVTVACIVRRDVQFILTQEYRPILLTSSQLQI